MDRGEKKIKNIHFNHFCSYPKENVVTTERKRKLHTHGVSVTFDPSGSSLTRRRGEVCVLSHPSSLDRSLSLCVCVAAFLVHTHTHTHFKQTHM